MDNIECAEILCDLLAEKEKLNLTDYTCEALNKARYETMCKSSPIGEHKCSVNIYFSPVSGREPIPVDTCLQTEIYNLIRRDNIYTVGSCCGHGCKQGFIEVADESVNKMIELGYTPIPPDKYENGQNRFIPKTVLPIPAKR